MAWGPLAALREYYRNVYIDLSDLGGRITTEEAFHAVLDATGWPRDWALEGIVDSELAAREVYECNTTLDTNQLRVAGISGQTNRRSSVIKSLQQLAFAEFGWIGETATLGIVFEGNDSRSERWGSINAGGWDLPSAEFTVVDSDPHLINRVVTDYERVTHTVANEILTGNAFTRRYGLAPREETTAVITLGELDALSGAHSVDPWWSPQPASGDYTAEFAPAGVTVPPDPEGGETPREPEELGLTFQGAIPNITATVGDSVNVQFPSASRTTGTPTDLVDYAIVGNLPDGLTFSAATRRVTGTAQSAIGPLQLRYDAYSDDGFARADFLVLVLDATPIIPELVWDTNTPDLAFQENTDFSYALATASGGDGTIAYSLTGDIPSGVTFDGGTGMLSGRVTSVVAAVALTLIATVGGMTIMQSFNFEITAEPPPPPAPPSRQPRTVVRNQHRANPVSPRRNDRRLPVPNRNGRRW